MIPTFATPVYLYLANAESSFQIYFNICNLTSEAVITKCFSCYKIYLKQFLLIFINILMQIRYINYLAYEYNAPSIQQLLQSMGDYYK